MRTWVRPPAARVPHLEAPPAHVLCGHPNGPCMAGVAVLTPLLTGTSCLRRGPSAGGRPAVPFPGHSLSLTWAAPAGSVTGGEAVSTDP